jgi:CRP-like cAMP-binding protein
LEEFLQQELLWMASVISEARPHNSLLAGLPTDEFQLIQQRFEDVELVKEQILSTQGESVQYVYFPTSGLVSCRASGSQGESVEIYAVGREGMVDPAAVLTSIAAVTAEVQIAGRAYRMQVDDVCTAIRNTQEFPRALLKYAYSLAVRMVQATKCAMFHTVKQRVVLWLLFAHRAHGNVIPCTHQAIAEALGARRASITLVLDSLVRAGLIERHRGRLVIANRGRLEDASCECFQLIKAGLEPDLECDVVAETTS